MKGCLKYGKISHILLIKSKMIDIRFKFLDEKVDASAGRMNIDGYQIYSSIYKPFPTVRYTYKTDYVMPDMLNCLIGQNNSLQYCINPTRGPDDEWINIGDVYLTSMELDGDKSTMKVSLLYNGAIDLYQVSDVIKSYKEKYGNEIVEDVINSNNRLQSYTKDFQKTDNYSTAYRSLGESDLQFILDTLCSDFTINGGKPLFFVGLDNVMHFTSVNSLLSKSTGMGLSEKNSLPTLYIDLGVKEGELTTPFLQSMVKDFMSQDYDKVVSSDFTMSIGGNKTYKNLKPALYFSSFTSPHESQTEKLSYLPATNDVQYYPISKFVYNTVDSTTTDVAKNRPNQNIVFEGQNAFPSIENLITIKTTIDNLNEINRLILAGDKVMITTPYAYSMYNGVYIISEIEYYLENGIGKAHVTCIRPHLETTWAGKLTTLKDSGKFEYPWAPEASKTMIYSI